LRMSVPAGTVAPMDRRKPRTIRLIGRLHAWLWKLTAGRLGNTFGRAPFMILITKGRITGRERRTPVLYFQHQADLIVVASFGGNDMHPAWYLNLESCPEAEIMIYGERRRVLAIRVSPEEKGLIWPRLIEMYPNFAMYQQRTRREIPLLRLSDRTIGARENFSGLLQA
jgi:F420H(2)-dependent quinone reductase